MADVKLTLGLELDPQSLASVAKQLDGLKSGLGSSGSSGATSEYKAFAEALALIKTRMRDAETEFRKLAIAQREGKGSQEELTKAKERAIATFQAEAVALEQLRKDYGNFPVLVEKVSVAQKSLVEAQQRVNVGFVGMATALKDVDTSIKASNNVLLEFGRGVSDAGMFALDFRMGMIAVANNVSQTADAVGRLVVQSKAQAEAMRAAGVSTNTFAIAMKNLGASLMGVNGLILGLNLALTAIQLWPKETDKAAEATDRLGDAARIVGNEFERLSRAITSSKEKAGLLFGDTAGTQDQIERLSVALKRLADEQAAIATSRARFATIGAFGMSAEERQKAVAAIDEQIVKNAKLIEVLTAQRDELSLRLEAQRRINGLVDEEVFKQRDINKSYLERRKITDLLVKEVLTQNAAIVAGQRRGSTAAPDISTFAVAAPENQDEYLTRLNKLIESGLDAQEAARVIDAQNDQAYWASRLEVASNYFSAVNDLTQFATNVGLVSAKKAFAIQKMASAGMATVDTIAAVQRTLADPTIPSLVVRKALAVSQGIAGAARVAAILSTPFGGRGGRSQTDRTSADGQGGFNEGFDFTRANNAPSMARSTAGFIANQPPVVNIYTQLNDEVLAYKTREGEAKIRINSTVLESDVTA